MILFFFKSMIQVSLVIFVFIHDYTVLMWLQVYAAIFFLILEHPIFYGIIVHCVSPLCCCWVFFSDECWMNWWCFHTQKLNQNVGVIFMFYFFYNTMPSECMLCLTYWVPSQMITCFRHIGLCLCDVIIVIIIDLY